VKKCVLTISLPNGLTQSYTTAPVYYKKVEAKCAAALVAMKNNVVEFIKQAEISHEESFSSKLAINPPTESVPKLSKPQTAIDQIINCCKELHGTDVAPQWYQTQVQLSNVRSCKHDFERHLSIFRIHLVLC
jgi:hypothetical protein